ncbi:MAG: transporter [Bacteroidia bacterium]|nr:MAG: transporter [Bacteroidia bacterium]
MKTLKTILVSLVFTISIPAQNNLKTFSLKEAIDYALTHSPTYLASETDVKSAKARNWEYTGIGLPQVSASFDLKDYIELPTSLLPGQFFGAPPGTYVPVRFGTQYNANAGISVSQIIFSSDYISALQASKGLVELTQKNLQRTKIETQVQVTKAYLNALVAKERFNIIQTNIQKLEKLLHDTKTLHENGFVEKIDLDRIQIAYNNLLTEKEKFLRLIGLSQTLLKYQMNYPLTDSIILTDSLIQFKDRITDIKELQFSPEKRIEYQIFNQQKKLNEIDLNRYKMQFLPSIVAYGSYTKNAQRTEFDVFDFSKNKQWFDIKLIGVTLNWNLFTSGQRYFRIKQAQYNVLKSQYNLEQIKQSVQLEYQSALTNYKNALASLKNQENNLKLAQSVFDTAIKKYEVGVGSNLEVVNAEASLKEAQTNYITALYDALNAKVDLDKALGNIQ